MTKDLSLRAHHLLCALTFRSRGYGPDFVQQFAIVVDKLKAGQHVQLGVHADVLCNSAQNCGQCHAPTSLHRDQLALTELQQLLQLDITDSSTSIHVSASTLEKLRLAFLDGSIRSACEGCAWFGFCSVVAKDNFSRARLQPTHD